MTDNKATNPPIQNIENAIPISLESAQQIPKSAGEAREIQASSVGLFPMALFYHRRTKKPLETVLSKQLKMAANSSLISKPDQ